MTLLQWFSTGLLVYVLSIFIASVYITHEDRSDIYKYCWEITFIPVINTLFSIKVILKLIYNIIKHLSLSFFEIIKLLFK